MVWNFLIRVSKAAHTTHHAQYVIVCSIHAHCGAEVQAHRVVGHSQQQCRVVNTRQVACATGLVLLGLESERVHIDAHGWDVCVVLVGLHQVEVGTLAHLESVVAVELEQGRDNGVAARHALHTGHGVARLEHRSVPPIRVVEWLLSLVGADHRVIAAHERVTLHNPHELLARVVEVQLDLVARGGDGLTASELEHIDQVLVRDLGELAALICVQVDIVHIERGGSEASLAHTRAHRVGVRGSGCLVPAEVVQRIELQIDAHLVVLERNQRQRQTRVAAEPELQGHIQSVHGCAAANSLGCVGLARVAGRVARGTTLVDEVRQLGHIANHRCVASLLAGLLCEFIPNM